MIGTKPAEPQQSLYDEFVNPQWSRLLDVLGMNVEYVTCLGSELFTSEGRRIVDFNSGYCVHNVAHNHPRVVAAIKHELERNGPAMFGQVLVMRLFRDRAIFSQICGNNFMVLKVAPALVIGDAQLEEFTDAIEAVVELMHASAGYWTEALGMVRRVINVI